MAVALVLTARGLNGEIKVEPLAPPGLFAKGARVVLDGTHMRIVQSQRSGRFFYLKLAGIETREWADSLRGRYLLLPESKLPPLPDGEYYRFQLLGLSVCTSDGRELGALEEILPNPGGDVYVVRGPLGEILIPAHEDFVQDVDLEARTITVEPIPGLLPNDP